MVFAQGWPALIIAGMLDVAWALSMKMSEGYTRPGWTITSLLLLGGFVFLLGRALATLPVGTAYAVWTGIGAVGTLVLGAAIFSETLSVGRITGVVLVIGGIVTLKLSPS